MRTRYHLCGIALLASAFHVHSQSITAKYVDSLSGVSTTYLAYDFSSGAALKVESDSRILFYKDFNNYYKGLAGTDKIEPVPTRGHLSSLRLVSIAFPQLNMVDISNDTSMLLIQEIGPLGGPTYEGTYPQGNRLMKLEDFPDPSRITSQRVLFDLDERGRLARIRHPDTGREATFDLAEDSTAEISYVKSFANGAWVLEDVQIYPSGKPELFDPEYVVKLARDMAFETAEARRVAQSEQVRTPEGRRKLEQLREEATGSGLSQSTKRFALILTGLIVIAVGSLAWWKNRS